jgi:anti-anti-sigma regulatory factor
VSPDISIERRSGGVKRLRALDGSLALVCSDSSIVQVFEITGLDRMIPMHRTLDDALLLTPVAA